MPGQVEIINLALTNLSKATITSIDESSEPARRAKAVWGFCREAVLRDYDWSFARRIVALTLSSNDTVINWDYVYVLPSDYIQARKVFNQGSTNAAWINWLYQNGTFSISTKPQSFVILRSNLGSYKILATNIEDAYLHYTADITDTTMFDSNFCMALAYYLAATLASIMTGDSKRATEMFQLYSMILSNAKANSSAEQYEVPDSTKNSPYYDCR